MSIHLYTVCWNEADMLGFFFRHYDPWVDKYYVWDDGSTDGSIDILKAHPRVVLRRFERTHPDSFVASHKVLQDNAWKESRGLADWVVVTAIDEHLVVPGCSMQNYLNRCATTGVTLVPALGYEMVSEEFPKPDEVLCQSRTWGAPRAKMSKLSIFNPDAIRETHFAHGRHTASPAGKRKLPRRDELLLLHYKRLGFERQVQRQIEQQSGLGPTDIANQWGTHYFCSREKLRESWNEFSDAAIDISQPDLEPWGTHPEMRWWRRPLSERVAQN